MIRHVINAMDLEVVTKPVITSTCLNGCDTCFRHCPVGAIDLNTKQVDAQKCTHCNQCTLHCPVGAIEGVLGPIRYILDGYLYVSASMPVQELYGWLAYKKELLGFFCHHMTVEQYAAISELKTYRRYQHLNVAKSTIDPAKRASVKSQLRLPPTYLRKAPFYQVGIVLEKCQACWVCSNACPTGAILRDRKSWVINQDLCTNCGRCYEMCDSKAIQVEQGEPKQELKHIDLFQCQCHQCQQTFYSTKTSQSVCFICLHKPKLEMRE